MFSITRTDLINDDTDALTSTPKPIGRGGMLALNGLVWSLFLNNSTFFTSGRNNPITEDLDPGKLQAAETKSYNQTDPDGNPLGILPSILLVPPSLRATAFTLMNSQLTIAGTPRQPCRTPTYGSAGSASNRPRTWRCQLHRQFLRSMVSLGVPVAIARHRDCRPIEQVTPTVEISDVDFKQLGVVFRGTPTWAWPCKSTAAA